MTDRSEQVQDYPHPLDLRWQKIEWVPFFFRRMRASAFWFAADLDVRGAAVTLFLAAMESVPPATLDDDPGCISFCLGMGRPVWDDLMQRKITPLHGWVPVRCGRQVKLTHPILLEALNVSVRAAKLYQRGTRARAMWSPPDAGRAPG